MIIYYVQRRITSRKREEDQMEGRKWIWIELKTCKNYSISYDLFAEPIPIEHPFYNYHYFKYSIILILVKLLKNFFSKINQDTLTLIISI